LLVESVSGTRIPGALLLPLGFALVVVATPFAALSPSTASLAAPIVVALAVIGLGISPRLRSLRADWWATAAGAGAYLLSAAPVVLSGRATFAGYIKLDDTATYFAMLDRAIAHGYDTAGLPPSTYEATVNTSLVYGYPLGSFLPLGMVRQLVGEDLAWLWPPY